MLPWLLCGLLSLIILAQWLKSRAVRRGLDEILTQMGERLEEDTNNLLFLSTRDRHVRRLASELNAQLKRLRAQRRKYQSGDRELKEAVTNVSHDLRTPLTAICGYLQLLDREDLPEPAVRYLSLIGERVQALRLLTEELFRYSVVLSTAEELHPEDVSLNGALEEAIAAFYAALTGRGIVPVIAITEQPVIRRLDRGALSRILSNILSNALKYSGGDLRVALLESGELLFENTAAGLDEVQVGRLFDRFFSVETASDSTGLGLAIARALAERMGGTASANYCGGKLSISVTFPKKLPEP